MYDPEGLEARRDAREIASPRPVLPWVAVSLISGATIAGLIVFLFGQGFLIVWNEWLDARERASRKLLARAGQADPLARAGQARA